MRLRVLAFFSSLFSAFQTVTDKSKKNKKGFVSVLAIIFGGGFVIQFSITPHVPDLEVTANASVGQFVDNKATFHVVNTDEYRGASDVNLYVDAPTKDFDGGKISQIDYISPAIGVEKTESIDSIPNQLSVCAVARGTTARYIPVQIKYTATLDNMKPNNNITMYTESENANTELFIFSEPKCKNI